MRKLIKTMILSGILTFFLSTMAYADIGDMGFFGGVSQGRKLPKTTEILLQNKNSKKTSSDSFIYKELILLSGRPQEFEGRLTKKESGAVTQEENSGTYTVTFTVVPVRTDEDAARINRNIVFTVNWRREGSQVIKDYEVKSWTETIASADDELSLQQDQSHFNVSIIEDHTPGVVYYKGNISMTAVYAADSEDNADAQRTTVQSTGSIYGYQSAWSNTETHRIDTWVYGNDWQMQYQLRPSVSVNKVLQYSENEPTAISFKGNYREVIQNQSALSYNIYAKPVQFYDLQDNGSINIPSYNSFEQLIAPDTSFLKGHFAEADINKLFSMQVLTGNPVYFKPEQAMTRGQFVMALAKAVKLPIEEVKATKKSKKNDVVKIVFPDVLPERAEYPYIMAAFNSGLAMGRDSGNFYIDSPIQRQEAIVILVRALGLENLGLDPTPATVFTDDRKIASWAKKEIYAAERLGIISGDEDGNFRPEEKITKAEGAAFINRLINYMRQDLVTDYTEHIINYAN
ncbi:S-layer homology domain-containing protein [Anaeropeptidivorans aminofermentans]|jgi:hypothetical protein|uniref:S-layer homology domain-containing protein n=1 Tax=Anaeropeptidivorans aminofermentans TaxID=2934315 RepID=UPI002024BC30|nr:S-layer homology domain-containing protein [Anaeropeptidivorans aminofermentans]